MRDLYLYRLAFLLFGAALTHFGCNSILRS